MILVALDGVVPPPPSLSLYLKWEMTGGWCFDGCEPSSQPLHPPLTFPLRLNAVMASLQLPAAPIALALPACEQVVRGAACHVPFQPATL